MFPGIILFTKKNILFTKRKHYFPTFSCDGNFPSFFLLVPFVKENVIFFKRICVSQMRAVFFKASVYWGAWAIVRLFRGFVFWVVIRVWNFFCFEVFGINNFVQAPALFIAPFSCTIRLNDYVRPCIPCSFPSFAPLDIAFFHNRQLTSICPVRNLQDKHRQ